MNTTLLNFWYAVEHIAALGSSPQQVTLFDTNYILYRDANGLAKAALDRCPHRGSSFKKGWMEAGCLRCPYHGWQFDGQGRCTEIPADQPGVPIPAKARLQLLPVVEKSGFVWIFPGDPMAADAGLIPDFPELNQPGWRPVSGEYEWDANFSRVVESGLDTSHAPFVHKNFFSNRDDAAIHPLEIKEETRSVSCWVEVKPPRVRGFFKIFLKKKERRYATTWLTSFAPNLNRMDFDLNMKGYRFVYFSSNIPVSANKTLTKWIEVRNFATTPLADSQFIKDTVHTYLEDKQVIETQEPGLTWELSHPELLLASDHLILAYRKKMASLLHHSAG
ncbi:MAG: Rieske 2Fe-2S domain-containing protein [Cyanobacteriota bacterium]|nr:Rieske 2Fe-2S domain-containing protein [Cyanobacteriota bacterium]